VLIATPDHLHAYASVIAMRQGPVTWRDFWAFGTGSFGDFGCHDMDAPCWALDLGVPESVEAFGVGASHPEIQPHGCLCRRERIHRLRRSGRTSATGPAGPGGHVRQSRTHAEAVGGPSSRLNFEYGARLTEITLLGVLALRLGQKIAWDAARMQVPGTPAADEIIHGTYRNGWEVT